MSTNKTQKEFIEHLSIRAKASTAATAIVCAFCLFAANSMTSQDGVFDIHKNVSAAVDKRLELQQRNSSLPQYGMLELRSRFNEQATEREGQLLSALALVSLASTMLSAWRWNRLKQAKAGNLMSSEYK